MQRENEGERREFEPKICYIKIIQRGLQPGHSRVDLPLHIPLCPGNKARGSERKEEGRLPWDPRDEQQSVVGILHSPTQQREVVQALRLATGDKGVFPSKQWKETSTGGTDQGPHSVTSGWW